MDGKLPEPEGICIADSLSAQELSNLPAIDRAGISLKLSDMQSDFVFFNHGILFTEIRLDTDPVQEFVYRSGQSDSVFFLSYDRPLFRNLVNPFWNSVIFGCKRELWPALRTALNSILFKALDKKVYSCFVQNV